MKVVFCEDPLQPRRPDEAYLAEVDAARASGLDCVLVNYETLVNDRDPIKAVRRVPEQAAPELGLYRGWMLRPEHYGELYAGLQQKGLQLINSPEAYKFCHHLPESYAAIEAYTPGSVWLHVDNNFSMDKVIPLLRRFGSQPVVVKDFVKSQKYYWQEACFIPSAADADMVKRVVERFLELQGELLNEGLVFREYVAFEPLATHAKSGMPLTTEFRIFVLDGTPLYVAEYWEEGDYQGLQPPVEQFADVMRRIASRFFTMDIAKRREGGWLIVELGDGQVAGLPERIEASKFYRALAEAFA